MIYSAYGSPLSQNIKVLKSHDVCVGGVWGLEPFHHGSYPGWLLLVIGIVKLFTISVTVISGFRGGFVS